MGEGVVLKDKVVSFNLEGVECRAGGALTITQTTNLPAVVTANTNTYCSTERLFFTQIHDTESKRLK